jgi:hypothetical protein
MSVRLTDRARKIIKGTICTTIIGGVALLGHINQPHPTHEAKTTTGVVEQQAAPSSPFETGDEANRYEVAITNGDPWLTCNGVSLKENNISDYQIEVYEEGGWTLVGENLYAPGC